MTAAPRILPPAVLLLMACKPEAERREDAAASQPPGPPVSHAPTAVAAPAPAATHKPRLAIEAEGLRLFTAPGAARQLRFGLPGQQLLDVLEALRGPAKRAVLSECGAGPLENAEWPDGLTLYFQEGRFAGWALERRTKAISTANGIAPGATRRALEAAYDARVEETTLGTEFSSGGLFGILDGKGPNARITMMWGGVSCMFR